MNVTFGTGCCTYEYIYYKKFNIWHLTIKTIGSFLFNFQKGHGHLDCMALITTNPDLVDLNYKLVIKTGFTYFRTHNGSKAKMAIEIKKSDDDIDLEFSVTGHLRPGAISLNALVRYSKGLCGNV